MNREARNNDSRAKIWKSEVAVKVSPLHSGGYPIAIGLDGTNT
jgi:hypothetical protein